MVVVPDLTTDAVLGGRLRLRQPRRGHRVGHDAILLAALTQASPGEHAVEFGAGVGAAGLALARRCPGLTVTLIDNDQALVALAGENARMNGFDDRVRALALDVAAAPDRLAAVDRVLMNPPFNDPERQQASPDARRRSAHVALSGTLTAWVGSAARLLRPGGTLTLIYRADGLSDVLAALGDSFGAVAVTPVHPKPDMPAIRVLVSAVKESRAPLTLRPGLTLADADGKPSLAAEAILRDAQTLG
jgi:tRNA1(Val) A37 N6-methylase TrmN6